MFRAAKHARPTTPERRNHGYLSILRRHRRRAWGAHTRNSHVRCAGKQSYCTTWHHRCRECIRAAEPYLSCAGRYNNQQQSRAAVPAHGRTTKRSGTAPVPPRTCARSAMHRTGRVHSQGRDNTHRYRTTRRASQRSTPVAVILPKGPPPCPGPVSARALILPSYHHLPLSPRPPRPLAIPP
ncbi:hypothetical protein FKP32DRAFT_374652 [Trametes sanguinea]|nr:hypothetical protein FKP32DRAFT_374652 [Trametes sanguinea]